MLTRCEAVKIDIQCPVESSRTHDHLDLFPKATATRPKPQLRYRRRLADAAAVLPNLTMSDGVQFAKVEISEYAQS